MLFDILRLPSMTRFFFESIIIWIWINFESILLSRGQNFDVSENIYVCTSGKVYCKLRPGFHKGPFYPFEDLPWSNCVFIPHEGRRAYGIGDGWILMSNSRVLLNRCLSLRTRFKSPLKTITSRPLRTIIERHQLPRRLPTWQNWPLHIWRIQRYIIIGMYSSLKTNDLMLVGNDRDIWIKTSECHYIWGCHSRFKVRKKIDVVMSTNSSNSLISISKDKKLR